jgi:hypothetical protein
MLHVFYVFSNITARMVIRTIEHLALNSKDVLILVDRSMKPASVSINARIELMDFEPYPRSWPDVFSNWRAVRRNSRRIDHLVAGINYIAYVPSPSDATCQQIIHHPACHKYHLIEEGLASYCPPGAKPLRMPLDTWHWRIRSVFKGFLCGAGRVLPTFTDFPCWKRKYAGCFSSNFSAFPRFPPPVVVLEQPLYQAAATPITRQVVFDDFSVFNASLQAGYLNAIRQVIAAEHRQGDHWAYKLHPRCAAWPALLAEAKRVFDETLPPGTPCATLAPDTSAEDIGLAPGVTTYGYMSSCLFYIHQCGGKVASFRKLVEARDPAFGPFWQRFVPPVLEPLVGDYRMIEDTYH